MCHVGTPAMSQHKEVAVEVFFPKGSSQWNSSTEHIHKHLICADHQIKVTNLNEDWNYLLHAELLPLPSRRCWYLKTNLWGLGFLIANIHAEVDLGRGFSFALPVYYSAVDYFGETSKYRTFTLQPEFRYWFNGEYTSFYAAAHAGLGWYNFTDGKWRIQDKDGKTPTIGGGVSAGYRLPIQKENPRWFVEFAVGAGVYPLHYDRFYNEKDGALESTRKETYFGIDQLAVNLVYKFRK